MDWNALVKKTATGITSAREYQMLWRHIAYCEELLEKVDDGAEPLVNLYIVSMMWRPSKWGITGAGSTPLHYAACGGNLKCCQILLARGASRLTLNCNGWLPIDVARMWGRHWLEPLLAVNSEAVIPMFPHSKYLSLPLMSVLDIARETGLLPSATSNEYDTCAVCLERPCSVAAEGSYLSVYSLINILFWIEVVEKRN